MSDPARHAQWPLRSERMTSVSRTQKQNVWSGFTLVSQSVSCCHAGKCILVFSKDLLTKYIVFCGSNLSGYLTHVVEWTHTQKTASVPSHPIQHPTAGMGTHMTPVGCVMAGCCHINYILTNIGRRNSIRILNQHPLFWHILIWTEFICFINLFAF